MLDSGLKPESKLVMLRLRPMSVAMLCLVTSRQWPGEDTGISALEVRVMGMGLLAGVVLHNIHNPES